MGERAVGVLGGMGPEATAHFYSRLIMRTPARNDQEHLRVLIDGNAKIPDRTTAIRNGSTEPRDALVASALLLQDMGAEILAMPCNSAHYWYDDIISAVQIPMLNMIEEVLLAVEEAGLTRVGLLATAGTVEAGVYAQSAGDLELIDLDAGDVERVNGLILDIKGSAGNPSATVRDELAGAVARLTEKGAEGIILGCTELPLILRPGPDRPVPLFDSTEILVEAVLREAYPRSIEGSYS